MIAIYTQYILKTPIICVYIYTGYHMPIVCILDVPDVKHVICIHTIRTCVFVNLHTYLCIYLPTYIHPIYSIYSRYICVYIYTILTLYILYILYIVCIPYCVNCMYYRHGRYYMYTKYVYTYIYVYCIYVCIHLHTHMCTYKYILLCLYSVIVA